MIVERLL